MASQWVVKSEPTNAAESKDVPKQETSQSEHAQKEEGGAPAAGKDEKASEAAPRSEGKTENKGKGKGKGGRRSEGKGEGKGEGKAKKAGKGDKGDSGKARGEGYRGGWNDWWEGHRHTNDGGKGQRKGKGWNGDQGLHEDWKGNQWNGNQRTKQWHGEEQWDYQHQSARKWNRQGDGNWDQSWDGKWEEKWNTKWDGQWEGKWEGNWNGKNDEGHWDRRQDRGTGGSRPEPKVTDSELKPAKEGVEPMTREELLTARRVVGTEEGPDKGEIPRSEVVTDLPAHLQELIASRGRKEKKAPPPQSAANLQMSQDLKNILHGDQPTSPSRAAAEANAREAEAQNETQKAVARIAELEQMAMMLEQSGRTMEALLARRQAVALTQAVRHQAVIEHMQKQGKLSEGFGDPSAQGAVGTSGAKDVRAIPAHIKALRNGLHVIQAAHERMKPSILAHGVPEVLQRHTLVVEAIDAHEKAFREDVEGSCHAIMEAKKNGEDAQSQKMMTAMAKLQASIEKAAADQQLIGRALQTLEVINTQAAAWQAEQAMVEQHLQQEMMAQGNPHHMALMAMGLDPNDPAAQAQLAAWEAMEMEQTALATGTSVKILMLAKNLTALFSDANLEEDETLKAHIKADGWVELSFVSCLPRMVELEAIPQNLAEAVAQCSELELSSDKARVRISETKRRERWNSGADAPDADKVEVVNNGGGLVPRIRRGIDAAETSPKATFHKFALGQDAMNATQFQRLLQECEPTLPELQCQMVWRFLGCSPSGQLTLEDFLKVFGTS
mmetsp:Transcript_58165/g.127516  ORF Transcript_58165/g.127516 Transcript_58165/m.127516 type:complete len:781 (+) Transcript_58165:123-2465(+)